jgi:cell division protease FtsH
MKISKMPKPIPPQPNRGSRITNILMFGLLALVLLSLLLPTETKQTTVPISQIASQINNEEVEKIVVSDSIQVFYKNGQKATSLKEQNSDTGTVDLLLSLGAEPEKLKRVEIDFQKDKSTSVWLFPLLLAFLPSLLIFAFLWMMFRQAKIGTSQAFDFTKAKARLFGAGGKKEERVTFNDIAGLEEAKEELKEIIDFLKNPKKYFRIGAKIPRGVLLVGPPGCGKTLLARAVANEANVPFFSMAGSEFIEMFVGVGSGRVRSLFAQTKKVGKAILFIDEIDSIGKSRGIGFGGGYEEREQTLNQLLSEMDGFERTSEVIVIGATNKPESLDPALLRPGRFDRRIVLDLPDIKDREGILKIHSRGKSLASDINFREVAERTPGFSGADLESLMNEAALLAAKRNKTQVSQAELLESIEKVMLGPERRSHVLNQREKEITAFHEAGHALVATLTKGGEKVRKISIIARGLAAGYTLKMPKEERKLRTRSEFLAELTVLLGGYVAEKIKFGDITTGASNDLKRASFLARKLVKEYGMSSLGPVTFGEREDFVFLPGEPSERKNYSEQMATKIDHEVSEFIKGAEKEAEKILRKNKRLLEKLAKTLMEKETIEKEEFEKILKSNKIN